jgi:hypothetical protein
MGARLVTYSDSVRIVMYACGASQKLVSCQQTEFNSIRFISWLRFDDCSVGSTTAGGRANGPEHPSEHTSTFFPLRESSWWNFNQLSYVAK